jgi:hypothetical protein
MHTAYAVPDQGPATPEQVRQRLADHRVRSLPDQSHWTPGASLPLTDGRVHCVRLTDHHAFMSAFGCEFELPKAYRHAYVRATLHVADQQLHFFFQESPDHKPEHIDTRAFTLPDEVIPYDASLIQDVLL